MVTKYVLNSLCRVSVKIKTHHHDVCSHNKRKDKRTPPTTRPKSNHLLIGFASIAQSASFYWLNGFLPFSLFIFPRQESCTWLPPISLALLNFFFFKGFF